MADTDWPATLPQSQFLGLTYQAVDGRVRTAMDAGPAKMRRRFTGVPKNVDVPILLTGTQLATFNTFFHTTLAEGVLSFNWDSPIDDSSVKFRFRAPVAWRLETGDSAPGNRLWSGTMQLEIMP